MHRERTTVSCAILALLVAVSVAMFSPTPVSADQAQIFPTDPAWTVDVAARPIAPPVSAGGRIFIALQSGLTAFDVDNGKELWRVELIAEGAIWATNERIIAYAKGALHALDPATGESVWVVEAPPLTGPLMVEGDRLFAASGNQLSTFNVRDGTAGWTAQEIGVIEERPAVAGDRVYVPVSDGALVVLSLSSGERLWETTDVGIKPAEPAVAGDRVLVGSAARRFCAFAVATGKQEWCFPIGAVVVGKAAVDDARIYVVALDNQLRALDRRNGNQKWKKNLPYRPSAGSILVGDRISVPGKTRAMLTFTAATGDAGPQLTFPADLAQPPVIVPPEATKPARLAAVVGDLQDLWKLTLTISPPPPLPKLKVDGLSELPGLIVPLTATRAPRE